MEACGFTHGFIFVLRVRLARFRRARTELETPIYWVKGCEPYIFEPRPCEEWESKVLPSRIAELS